MQHLKHSLTRPLNKVATGAVVFLLVVAVLGFADAGYLTVEHYRGVIPPCTVTSGCEKVLTSDYSVILGVPVPLLGAIYYLYIVVSALIYLEAKHLTAELKDHHSAILKWALLATVLGFLMSLWFLYLQAFVIGSYCQYCLGSAATSITLFITALCIIL